MKETVSQWKGSTRTGAMVAAEIGQRWGSEEVKNYDPAGNCFTLRKWNQMGYKVKAGEKAIRSVTWITEGASDEDNDHARRYPKTVCLFYIRQVERRDGAPVAQCGRTIAEAFGLDKIPGTVIVEDRAPGVTALEFGFNKEVLA
jgi:hypothetical protein